MPQARLSSRESASEPFRDPASAPRVPCAVYGRWRCLTGRRCAGMMRPTPIKGESAVAYYDALVTDEEVARRPSRVEDYYLSTDEQAGVWWGQAAGELGLVGESSREDFHALMAGVDPRSGEALGRRLRSDG